MVLEYMFENGKLAVYLDFETLIGWVMDYRGVFCTTVLVFGPDSLFPGRSFAPTLFCAKN
jgi:hypothetical protein